MEQVSEAPKPRAKQDFSIGNTVRIGGNEYRVTGHKPAPAKGQAPIVELVSHDRERRYEWQPFRGLRVIGAPPKRIRKRHKKGTPKPIQAGQRIERLSLWTRLVRRVTGKAGK